MVVRPVDVEEIDDFVEAEAIDQIPDRAPHDEGEGQTHRTTVGWSAPVDHFYYGHGDRREGAAAQRA